MKHTSTDAKAGLLYGLAAYGFWGIMPLYFQLVRHVSPWELVAHRIVWSLMILLGMVWATRGWLRLALAYIVPRTRRTLIITSVLIAVNWCAFTYATISGRNVEASLGYFMMPLVNAALGVIVLRERLRRAQKVAIGLCAIGVILLATLVGQFPWLALLLVTSFGVYGLLRKTVAADALIGLTVESIFLAPIALGYIIWLLVSGDAKFAHVDRQTDLFLLTIGAITVAPLYCFAQAARRLKLTTIGFLQYISPTAQFLLAVFVFGEPFHRNHLIGFAFVWAALAVFTVDALHARRKLPI